MMLFLMTLWVNGLVLVVESLAVPLFVIFLVIMPKLTNPSENTV